jgi:hypothetical protein
MLQNQADVEKQQEQLFDDECLDDTPEGRRQATIPLHRSLHTLARDPVPEAEGFSTPILIHI